MEDLTTIVIDGEDLDEDAPRPLSPGELRAQAVVERRRANWAHMEPLAEVYYGPVPLPKKK